MPAKKRGAIEIQFNWIFVLVVGALILGFFVMLVHKHMESSELEKDVSVQNKLKTIIKNAKQSTGSVFEVDLKGTEILYSDCSAGFQTGEQISPVKIPTAFAPDLIKSSIGRVYLWAVDWNMPYRVDNFIFITSSDIRYVVVNSTNETEEYALEVFNGTRVISLPDRLSKEFIQANQLSQFKLQNYYQTVFIFFERSDFDSFNPQDFSSPDLDVSAILIEPEEGGLDGWGNLEFEGSGESNYSGRASVFAAIFSENKSHYECGMREAVERLNLVSKVYRKRTEKLDSQLTSTNDDCVTKYDVYTPALGYLDSLIAYSESFDTTKFDSIYANALSDGGSLKTLNNQAMMKSCPLIY